MNNQNLVYLLDTLKFLGFGEGGPLGQEVEEQLAKTPEEFQLYTETFHNDGQSKLEAKLYFMKSSTTDFYYLSRYDALLRHTNDPEKDRAQTIYIFKGRGFTFKETFNLLEGRAVYRERENLDKIRYYAWNQMDFYERDQHGNYRIRQYGNGYQYNLEDALKKYPLLELQNDEIKAAMIRSLQRGNMHQVTLLIGNKREKRYIEANPKEKSIILHPQAMSAASKKTPKDEDTEVETPFLPDSDPDKEPAPEGEKEPMPLEVEIIGVPAEISVPEFPSPVEEQPGTVTATRTSHRKRIYK